MLRAAEIDADVILLAKNVDGVYTADPVKDPTAVKYDTITYDDVLAQHLAVMDSTATSLSMDNHIPVLLFALKDPENIIRALCGEKDRNHCQGGPDHDEMERKDHMLRRYKVYEDKMQKDHRLGGERTSPAVRAGRANAAVLDRIMVDYYGSPHPHRARSRPSPLPTPGPW